jgi:hypothetical protein
MTLPARRDGPPAGRGRVARVGAEAPLTEWAIRWTVDGSRLAARTGAASVIIARA